MNVPIANKGGSEDGAGRDGGGGGRRKREMIRRGERQDSHNQP